MTNNTPPNPPAFPSRGLGADHFGMNLLDWFAGQALGALTANTIEAARAPKDAKDDETLAEYAYGLAYAMLEARRRFGPAPAPEPHSQEFFLTYIGDFLDALRNAGYAVVVFKPEDVGDKDAGDLEDLMHERGVNYLNWRTE